MRRLSALLVLLLVASIAGAQTLPVPTGSGAGGGSGSVSSVGLSMPSQEFSVANSPVTSSGTLTVTRPSNGLGNITGATSVDWNNGATQTGTQTGNVTFTFSNPVSGTYYVLILTAGSGFSYTWPAAVTWLNQIASVTQSNSGGVDYYTFYYDGTTYWGRALTQTVTPQQGCNPRTCAYVSDDFIGGASTTGAIGALGWTLLNNSAAIGAASVANHPGLFRMDTGATAQASGALSAVVLRTGTTAVATVQSTDLFDLFAVFRCPVCDNNTTIRVGLSANPVLDGGNGDGIWIERLASGTTLNAITRASSVQSSQPTITYSTNTFANVRIRRISATTIGFTVNGGTEIATTTNVTAVALQPFFQVYNWTGASTKNLDLDYFDLTIPNILR